MSKDCKENSNKEQETCCCEQSHVAEKKCCCEHEEKVEQTCCCEHEQKHTHQTNQNKSSTPTESVCNCHTEESKSQCCCHEDSADTSHKDSCCATKKGSSKSGSCCGAVTKVRFYNTTKYKIVVLAISLVALILSLLWEKIAGNGIGKYFNAGWIAIVLCGLPIVVSAFESLFINKKIRSSLLITTALVACIVLEILNWTGVCSAQDGHSHSNIFAAGEVVFLMMIGELIEDITVHRSRKGIEKLINLAPTTANVRMGDSFAELPISMVQVGDIVLVKPFEKISVDGIVLEGSTAVNTSAITGESVPVDVAEGDSVYAGTWNENGAIQIKVTKPSSQTTVAKMITLVKQAEENKAPIASTADKWAGIIVPGAIIMAVLVFVITFLAMQQNWQTALYRAVTVLVVFCPCALALATPTAIAAAIGNAGYNGILVKSGLALETLAKVDTMVFDKTGTLTVGKVRVSNVITSMDRQQFMLLAASCEQNSEHPLAKAIVECAQGQTLLTAQNTESLLGTGVCAEIEGKKVTVAKYTHFSGEQLEEFSVQLQEELSNGHTVVALSVDDKVSGLISLFDEIKPNCADSLTRLAEYNINTVMLTGDNAKCAENISNKAGIKEYYDSLLPQDKVTKVEQLKANHTVCMVGDGVNDAPALATANCSIAMGAIGSDVALEVADIALMHDKMEGLPLLIKLAKRTLFTIKRNIIISMSINLIAVVLSLFGILNPVWGALVHNCSSVFVVFSSSLLLANKKKKDLTQPKQ